MLIKKEIRDFTIVNNIKISDEFFILELKSDEKLPLILPGQFIQILIENSEKTFLRRPFSIHDINVENNIIVLLIQIMGNGTRQLSYLKVGVKLNVIFPLGNSFSLTKPSDNVLLIGGGCGVAPLLLLAKKLNSIGTKINIIIGGRNKESLLRTDEYEKYAEVFYTTEDGSKGQKGYIIHHPILWDENINFNKIYSCGPEPMLKAVAKYSKSKDKYCEVSLENTMACGIGACLCCVVDTIEGHKCVCSEGPIFDSKKLLWQI